LSGKTGIMRVLFLAVVLAVGSIFTVNAQNRKPFDKVPTEAVASVEKQYPSTAWVEWYKNEAVYTAVFNKFSRDYHMIFDVEGNWQKVKREMFVQELPFAIIKSFNETPDYIDWTVEQVREIKINTENGVEYQYELDVSQGRERFALFYNSKGELLEVEERPVFISILGEPIGYVIGA
jgi:uncharacterized protein YpmB